MLALHYFALIAQGPNETRARLVVFVFVRCDVDAVDALLHHLEIGEKDHVDKAGAED